MYASGPIFDSYGPNYVIIPGSIGMVASLICFSFSKGTYTIHRNTTSF